MASDALFQELSKALARPSRAYRTAEAGLSIPDNVIGGYEQGLQTRQDVAKLKLLNTPLGQIFGSQENIPYGLHPTDTFGTLATVAGSMKDYVNPGVASSVLNAYSDTPTAPPANPSATLPPQQGDSPLPVGPNGKADLSQVLGAPAPSPSMPDNGALPPPITLPPGGMNKATMDVVLPAVKAQSEMRLKKQEMAQQRQMHDETLNAENSRAQATQIDDFTKANTRVMSGFDAMNQLESLLNKVPSSQRGAGVGLISKFAGASAGKQYPDLSTFNQARHAFIGDFAAALDPMGRQNVALLAQVDHITPTVNDDPKVAANKMEALRGFLTSQVNRNYQGYNSAAGSFGKSIPRPNIPKPQPRTFNNEQEAEASGYKGPALIAGRRAVIH